LFDLTVLNPAKRRVGIDLATAALQSLQHVGAVEIQVVLLADIFNYG